MTFIIQLCDQFQDYCTTPGCVNHWCMLARLSDTQAKLGAASEHKRNGSSHLDVISGVCTNQRLAAWDQPPPPCLKFCLPMCLFLPPDQVATKSWNQALDSSTSSDLTTSRLQVLPHSLWPLGGGLSSLLLMHVTCSGHFQDRCAGLQVQEVSEPGRLMQNILPGV